MRLWVEIPAFAALATGLHLALFAGWPGGAPGAAGDGGAGTLTLSAARGDLTEIVAAWDAPPAAAPPVVPPAPPGAERPVAAPTAETAPPRAPVPEPAEAPREARPPAMPEAPAPPAAPAPAPPPAPPVPRTASAPEAPAAKPAAPRAEAPAPPAPPATAAAPPAAEAPPVPAARPRARPAQVAAGSGDTGLRGAGRETAATGLSESARQTIVATWGAEIRARIEARKVHPEGIRASGRPVVRITVARSGAVEDVRVVRSSRIAALDEAAVRAVRRAGRLPAAPGGLDLARVSFDLPISFTR